MFRILTITAACAIVALPVSVLASGKTAAPDFELTTNDYTQDFNGLANSGSNNTALPAGFQIVELGSGSRADGTYDTGTGSSNAGDVYSLGDMGSVERALGSLTSGSLVTTYLGGIFTNGLGATITDLLFGYRGEHWRGGSATNDMLTFQYSLNASQLDNGNWIEVSSLNYMPVGPGSGARNGNADAVPLSGLISNLSIADGESFGFRWVDNDVGGSDEGMGIDDLRITAITMDQVGAVPEPATWALLLLGFFAIGAGMRHARPTRGVIYA